MSDMNDDPQLSSNPEPPKRVPASKQRKSHKKRNILIIVLLALIVIGLVVWLVAPAMIAAADDALVEDAKNFTEEEFAVLAPFDEEKALAIDAMPSYGKDDTWAIYIYMCGSDLESNGISELSYLTDYSIADTVAEIEYEKDADDKERLQNFINTIRGQGMDLPASLYNPDTYLGAVSEGESTEAVEPDTEGAASSDLREILAVDLPENIRIVIQTGGARRWEVSDINPNRSQRFLYSSNGFEELENRPVVNMGSGDALADFLTFCRDNYSADHTVFLFWNHGGGAYGVCWDELFGSDNLTLAEIRNAFSQVYTLDVANPPFEAVGFDACLMASLEVAHSLSGVARYLAASEELEPGTGWDHAAWLGALAENPSMNGAQLCKVIADSYMRSQFWLTRLLENSLMIGNEAHCFSVTDLTRVDDVYQAYSDLCAAILRQIPSDRGTITTASIAAARSISYASSAYQLYNTIDLGVFADNLAVEYPDEIKVLKNALDSCVLYTRGCSYEQDSQGLSVYFPVGLSNDSMQSFAGLQKYLDYIDHISADPNITALYYYKLAGCLSPELQTHLDENGFDPLPNLDIECLRRFSDIELTVTESGFSLPITREIYDTIQDAILCLARYDGGAGTVTYLGENRYVDVQESLLSSEYGNKWLFLDDVPLHTDIIDASNDRILYRSLVEYNGKKAYLVTDYTYESGKSNLLGIRFYDSDMVTLDRNLVSVKQGDKITPLYPQESVDSRGAKEIRGKRIKLSSSTQLSVSALEDGTYLAYVSVNDCRGDGYATSLVMFDVRGGEVVDPRICDFLKVF